MKSSSESADGKFVNDFAYAKKKGRGVDRKVCKKFSPFCWKVRLFWFFSNLFRGFSEELVSIDSCTSMISPSLLFLLHKFSGEVEPGFIPRHCALLLISGGSKYLGLFVGLFLLDGYNSTSLMYCIFLSSHPWLFCPSHIDSAAVGGSSESIPASRDLSTPECVCWQLEPGAGVRFMGPEQFQCSPLLWLLFPDLWCSN